MQRAKWPVLPELTFVLVALSERVYTPPPPLEWDSGMRAHVILPPSPPPPPFHFFPRTLREVSWTVPSTNQHCTPLAGRTYRENLETSPKHFPLIFSLRRTHSYVSFNCGKLFLSPNPLGCLYRLERNVTLPCSFFFFCSGNAETNAVKLEFYENRIA